MIHKLSIFLVGAFLFLQISTRSQGLLPSGSITGNIQLDFQYYQKDRGVSPLEKMGMNTWADFIYQNKAITAGIRYEAFQNALIGFPTGTDGQGFPYKFIGYKKGDLSVTIGSYYVQFGNGLLLRTYQEKGLGIDNALNGAKLEYTFFDKIYLTALSGKERIYFDLDESIIRAADIEIHLSDFVKKAPFIWKSGASYVNRYYPPGDIDTLYPAYVDAYSFRSLLRFKKITLEGEIAKKSTDPSAINLRNDDIGTAWYINTSYHSKGLGLSAQYKAVTQFDFRSNPANAQGLDYFLNFLPPISRQYSLKEFTRYPFVSTGIGEEGVQFEATYSPIRGKTFLFNYSKVHKKFSFNQNENGKPDDKLYESIYVEGDWKFSKTLKGIFAYQYIDYDQILQGTIGNDVFAHLFFADLSYRIARKKSIRGELQYLMTKYDPNLSKPGSGDWIYGLLEYTIAPHYSIAVIDEVNIGGKDPGPNIHFYTLAASYTKGSNKFLFNYGRQSAGYQCAGGICRPIPAYTGFGLSVLSSF